MKGAGVGVNDKYAWKVQARVGVEGAGTVWGSTTVRYGSEPAKSLEVDSSQQGSAPSGRRVRWRT